ncbi:protein always early 3-like [Trifolium medium]|uniref:Protein always early 3-like n=1 Tax=Trifolium medium TaxID=97028 RepID=A0A392MX37_9FABA|nr:protein always early 3-like [Trifolium medium]
MPMSLIRHHITPSRINENLSELTRNGKLAQRKISENTILSLSDNSNAIKGRCVPPTMHGFSSSCKSQAKAAGSEICNGQSASSSQSSFLERVHSKEADILAISELTRALEKKELVLSELKHMNDGVSESQKYGDNSVKDSEPFKRNYASVLKQLSEANEQAGILMDH